MCCNISGIHKFYLNLILIIKVIDAAYCWNVKIQKTRKTNYSKSYCLEVTPVTFGCISFLNICRYVCEYTYMSLCAYMSYVCAVCIFLCNIPWILAVFFKICFLQGESSFIAVLPLLVLPLNPWANISLNSTSQFTFLLKTYTFYLPYRSLTILTPSPLYVLLRILENFQGLQSPFFTSQMLILCLAYFVSFLSFLYQTHISI